MAEALKLSSRLDPLGEHSHVELVADRNADTSLTRRSMRASWERWSREKHAACSPIASRSLLGMASTTATISATERTVLLQWSPEPGG
jgi:hypothetical protein